MMLVILYYFLLIAGCSSAAEPDEPYDYSASIECLVEPLAPQYGGGLVTNPGFDSGLGEWSIYATGKIELRESKTGNKFIAAYRRYQPVDSFARSFHLKSKFLYTFSAWVQVDIGKEFVTAVLKAPNPTNIIIGHVIAKSGCWSMLKGGFTVDEDMYTPLYFQSNNTKVELWVDNVSLKPFSRKQWRNQQHKSIDQVRKKKIRIHVTDDMGQNIEGARITLNETIPHFHLGCSSTEAILNNEPYQNWFTPRFTATTFNNEMKWYYTEVYQGKENYTVPDAMVSFFQNHSISIRGHTILWANRYAIPYWVKILSRGHKGNLPNREILNASIRRMVSIVSRYAGKVIAWDVFNENLHYSYYEDEVIGPNASGMIYQIARALDPKTPLYINEFNVMEHLMDLQVTPSSYVEKVRQIRSYPGNEKLVIGLGIQGHFGSRPNVSHVRAVLDYLGETKMPIWFTELDTKRGPNQAVHLEDVLREAYAHPAVEGIIVWGGWKPTACNQTCLTDRNFDVLPKGCAEMCLTDDNFSNLPTGDVVDKLIREWKTTNVKGVTNKNGTFETNVFQGGYSLTLSHPKIPSVVQKKIRVINENAGALELSISL